MLRLEDKINILKHFLEEKNDNYADLMKDELYFHFFENENDISFLENLKTEKEIEEKIDFLTSKMIMLENKEGLTEIIYHYG